MASDRKFEYLAVDSKGRKKKGIVEAVSDQRAYQLIQAQGFTPVKVVDMEKNLLAKELHIPGVEFKAKLKSLAVFTKQFALLIRAGIPMFEALKVLAEQTEDKVLKKALTEVYQDVEQGASLANSMSKHPLAFPDLFVAVVRVGEDGGFLERSLASMAKTYKSELELKQKVKSAMMYPIIVVSVSVLVLVAMLIFVVPTFGEMFESMNAKLPPITQALVDLSKNMGIALPVAAVVVIILTFLYKHYKKEEWLQSRVDNLKLKFPIFGKLNTKISISRFTSNLSMMLSAGVSLIPALKLVSSTANNWVMSTAIDESVSSMENGKSFSASIDGYTMFPPMVKSMIVVGENSGSLDLMLETVGEFYDDEVKETSDNLASAIEPLLIVTLGVLIGGMLMALYMPMFSLFNVMSSSS